MLRLSMWSVVKFNRNALMLFVRLGGQCKKEDGVQGKVCIQNGDVGSRKACIYKKIRVQGKACFHKKMGAKGKTNAETIVEEEKILLHHPIKSICAME